MALATAARNRASSDKRRDRALFDRYQQGGDLHARRELIERYLPLARSVARRYEHRGESYDDLLQVASLGLLKAIDRFEVKREVSFSSYAVPTMMGELRRHFRDSSWALHVPREMQERVLKLNAAVERLSAELRLSPTPQQLADELRLSVEEVLEAMAAGAAYDTASLDTHVSTSDDDSQLVAATVGELDERLELIEDRAAIGPALKTLPERDRLILHLRFVEDLSQSQIAARVGLSQMHVSRLIRRTLERIRVAAA
jgi:RNA polymerase sigma-B factor